MVLTDKEFFLNCIDYDIGELKDISNAARLNDFALCRKLLADYVKQNLFPEKYFGVFPMGELTEDIAKKADTACKNILTSVGIPYDFKDNIDWEFNPTENSYKEWTWQLNRHAEWASLAHAYSVTKDRKYLNAFCFQLKSWLNQANVPPIGTGRGCTFCWRTIEAGIRQGIRWPRIIHVFYRDMPDDLLVDWCKSIHEHGVRLAKDHSAGSNWLMMEMNGLATLSVLYPWLKHSNEWRELADEMFLDMLKKQIYPDGAQYELSTSYQSVCTLNYSRPIKLYKAYGYPALPQALPILEKLYEFWVKLKMPDGRAPALNDAELESVTRLLESSKGIIKNDLVSWALGESDILPPFESFVFEYAGLAALRSGWSEDDTYICFDGGPLGAGHFHEDKLSLTLYADRRQLLCDGNNYAYDTSEMRKYVLSSRSHNTVLVDGHSQARSKTTNWYNPDLQKKADLWHRFSERVDIVGAIYSDGYGPTSDQSVTHRRDVYFYKKIDGLKPFAVVVDRMDSAAPHTYDVLWHIDAESAQTNELNVKGATLNIVVPNDAGLSVEIVSGQTEPVVQGWTCNSAVQGDYRPVPTAIYRAEAKSIRIVTILYPDGNEEMKIVKVIADRDINSKSITIITSDERTIQLDEQDI